jgi:hypothetical protein
MASRLSTRISWISAWSRPLTEAVDPPPPAQSRVHGVLPVPVAYVR